MHFFPLQLFFCGFYQYAIIGLLNFFGWMLLPSSVIIYGSLIFLCDYAFLSFSDVDTVIEVLTATFKRLCENLEQEELNLMWNCLYQRVDDSVNDGDFQHLSCLLSLLVSIIQINNGMKVSGEFGCITPLKFFVVWTRITISFYSIEKGNY